jgi:hypothetical protein
MMEICLTKIFSIVLWYHFGFLAVSSALLGFASSGVYLALRGARLDPAQADASIARAAAAAALVAVASLWLVTQTTFDVYSVIQDRTLGVLLALVVWVTLPFFFLGLVISRTLSAYPERVGSLYAADLIGSALGCGGAVLLLGNGVSGPAAILSGALLVGIGGMLFAAGRAGAMAWAALGTAAPLLALVLGDPQQDFPLLSPRSKPLYRVENLDRELRDRGLPGWQRGRVGLRDGSTLEIETPLPPALTDDGRRFRVETDDGPRELAVDEIARAEGREGLAFEPTPWTAFRRWSSTSRVDAFHWPKVHGSWGLWGLSERHRGELRAPIPRQKGITIDAWAMTSIMRYSGAPLQPAGTPAVDAERAKLQVLEYLPAGTVYRVKPAPDRVLCIGAGGGLDLLTAKYFGAGHVTGVEINSGVADAVREAFPDFAGHLYDSARHPDVTVHVAEGRHYLERSAEQFDIVQLSGVDTFSTSEAGAFSLSENFLYTVEAFRTYFRHLRDSGIVTLTRWFYPVLRGEGENERLVPRYSLRLIGLARMALHEHGVARPQDAIFFLKSQNFTVILVRPQGFSTAEGDTLVRHCEHYGYDVLYAPHRRTERIPFVGRTFPNPFQEFMDAADPDAHLAASPFDVSPPRDDRPFFFEISRFGHIFARDHYLNPLGGLTAHGILMLLFAEVVLLGLLFVILPLRRLSRARQGGNGRLRLGLLIYFTAIGFGFIVVEIVLAQKFVLFLGHPFHALAVILFSVLMFSGIGAGLSGRMPLPHLLTPLAGGLAILSGLAFEIVFEAALHLPLWVRIAISVAMLAPVGLVMGMPFPAGIRALAARRAELIPWAWGINGYTSVLGSVMAVILGISLGFRAVLLIAAGVYALGAIGYSLMVLQMRGSEDLAPDHGGAAMLARSG